MTELVQRTTAEIVEEFNEIYQRIMEILPEEIAGPVVENLLGHIVYNYSKTRIEASLMIVGAHNVAMAQSYDKEGVKYDA